MAIETIGLYPITIDVYKKHKESTVYANDNDMNGRGLLINLVKNNASFDSTGITLKIGFRNAVGEERLYDCDIVDVLTGQYKVFYPTEMLVGNGGRVVKLEIKAYESTGALLNYAPIFVYVNASEIPDDAISGTNEASYLKTLTDEVLYVQDQLGNITPEQITHVSTSESARVTAEGTRISNESARITAENLRANAETSRNESYNTAEVNRDDLYEVAEAGRSTLVNSINAQLAETGNRIDNIIATPIDLPEIYVDEIHDARQGKGSIGANITEVKSQLTENESRIKEVFVNVKDYGAVGDWDGTAGTDNLASFNNAVAALPESGGEILVPDGDYLISNTWIINKERVVLKISANATIRCNVPTSTGTTIAFSGHYGSGTATTPQRQMAKIYGGGTVLNTSSGTNENAIGCSRHKTFICEGMNLPNSNRKAITCQYGVENIFIEKNIIGDTGHMGISIETACKNIRIKDNLIKNSGNKGIGITTELVNSYDIDNIEIDNNQILISGSDGIYVDNFTIAVLRNNKLGTIAGRGIALNKGYHVVSEKNIVNQSSLEALQISQIAKSININGNFYRNPSFGNSGVYSAISIATVDYTPMNVKNNVVKGTTHKYAVNISSSQNNQGVFEDNQFDKGVSDLKYNYGGWIPLKINDYFDGSLVEVENRKRIAHVSTLPTDSQWTIGDYAKNTAKTIQGTAPNRYMINGWYRLTNGTNNVLGTDWFEDRSPIGS